MSNKEHKHCLTLNLKNLFKLKGCVMFLLHNNLLITIIYYGAVKLQ